MTRALVVAAACLALAGAACKKQQPPPPADRPTMAATEIKRDQDACKTYVDKVCACAQGAPAMQQPCALARALPDAIQVSLDVAANPESSRLDVLQALDSVRKIAKECIEETAKLPAAGCP
jgi:hypothetical protein